MEAVDEVRDDVRDREISRLIERRSQKGETDPEEQE